MSANQVSQAAGTGAALASLVPGGQIVAGGLGVVSGIASIFGGMEQDRAEQRAIDAKYDYDMQIWEYNNDERKRDYKYRRDGVKIARRNQEAQIAYQEATALQEWKYDQAIQDYRFDLAMREYAQSEQNYKLQLGFNNMAAAEAYESEQRKFNEIMNAQAFAREDQSIAKVEALGKAKMLQAGRSKVRAQAVSMAEIGRTIGRLDESFRSAKTETKSALRAIAMQKYGADLRAFSNRIIEPTRLPDIPKPLALPRPEIQDAYKPGKAPKPMKGVAAGGGLMAGLSSGLSSIGSGALNIAKGVKDLND